jgi:uncharacterized FlgJ-related protein
MRNVLSVIAFITPLNSVTYSATNPIKIDDIDVLESQIRMINVDSIRSKKPRISITDYLKIDKKLKDYEVKNLTALISLYPIWEYLERVYHIPKYISISFWIEETGWGKSRLFKKNNLGGIRRNATSFAEYKTLLDGVKAWGRVLSLDRYINKVNKPDNYLNWLKAYDKGGYWGNEDGIPNRKYHIDKLNLTEL